MLPPLPPWLAPKYVLTGVKLVIAGALLLFAVVGCTTQTVRLEGLQLRLPLIGSIGPQGWKPYAEQLERDNAQVRVKLDQAEARHAASKRAYAEAQEEAARIQADAIERTIARQKEITNEVRQDYNRRIADLRSRADRLRAEARADHQGATSEMRLPADGGAPARADAAPDCAAFPAPDLDTEITCREIAEQQATQLDALIDWVTRQLGAQP